MAERRLPTQRDALRMGERRPSPYPKITAAIKAARRAGEKGEVRVEVDGITVVSSPPSDERDHAEANEWDAVQ